MIDWKRRLPILLALGGFGAVAAGLGIATAEGEGAGPPVKFFPLATAPLEPFADDLQLKDGGRFRLSIEGETVFGIRQVTIEPGAYLPWHQHPGSAVIVLAEGTLAEYNTAFPHCGPLIKRAPYSRFEPGDSTHMLVNKGKDTVVVLAATWDSTSVAESDKLIIPKPAPKMAGCPATP
jgi:hypothetical protein